MVDAGTEDNDSFAPATVQHVLHLKKLGDTAAQFAGPNWLTLRMDRAEWDTLCRPVELRVTLVDNLAQLHYDAEKARA